MREENLMDPMVANFVNAIPSAPTTDTIVQLFNEKLAEATADSVEDALRFLRSGNECLARAAEKIDAMLQDEK